MARFGKDLPIEELGTSYAHDRRDLFFDVYERLNCRHVDGIAQILMWRDQATDQWLATTTLFPKEYAKR